MDPVKCNSALGKHLLFFFFSCWPTVWRKWPGAAKVCYVILLLPFNAPADSSAAIMRSKSCYRRIPHKRSTVWPCSYSRSEPPLSVATWCPLHRPIGASEIVFKHSRTVHWGFQAVPPKGNDDVEEHARSDFFYYSRKGSSYVTPCFSPSKVSTWYDI